VIFVGHVDVNAARLTILACAFNTAISSALNPTYPTLTTISTQNSAHACAFKFRNPPSHHSVGSTKVNFEFNSDDTVVIAADRYKQQLRHPDRLGDSYTTRHAPGLSPLRCCYGAHQLLAEIATCPI
jgi:hypothetical protein